MSHKNTLLQKLLASIKGSFLYIAISAVLMGAAIPLGIMQYGLDNPTAVGPYLDGNLPATGGSSWDVVEAFPNLTFDDPLQMIEITEVNAFMLAGKYGKIWSIPNNDTTISTKNVVLDITTDVYQGGDTGLLGLAAHPKFGKGVGKDYIYVWYRHKQEPRHGNWAYLRLVRYEVNTATLVANPASAFIMINQLDRHQWHNGGGMFFDKEGFLYITVGDEGGAQDVYGNGQKINEGLLSGMLRIDVDMDPSRSHPVRRQPQNTDTPPPGWPDSYTQGYYIPDDNPFLSTDSLYLEEFYAIGLRSPHRSCYDSVDGYIFVGDIGQGLREEIDLVQKGSNMQWPFKEGELSGAHAKPDSLIGIETPPFMDYPRSMGTSVIGGVVYRGTKFPSLYGKYIFGDHTVRRMWAIDPLSGEMDYLAEVPEFGVGSKAGISSFATDSNGEIYVTKLFGQSSDGGKIYKLIKTAAPDPAPALLSMTGAFSDLTNMTPHDYVIPYELNVPFWSDNAHKYRWLVVPNDGTHNTSDEQVTFRKYDAFDWPIGTVFIKHFEYQMDDQNPADVKKIETRFLVKGSDENIYGLTYKWREDQTDADLLSAGLLDTLTIQTTLGPREVHWYYPGDTECSFCHNVSAGKTLGPKSVQLNGDTYYSQTGRTANQLKTLSHLGIFSNPPDTSALDELPTARHIDSTAYPMEDRAKAFLDINCGYCHRPNTSIRANFDARFKTPLGSMNLIMGLLEHPIEGESENRVIVPGKPEQSMLYRRLAAVHDEISMPPLAKNLMDSASVSFIEEWILSMDEQAGMADLNEGRIAFYDFEGHFNDVIGDADGVARNGGSIINDPERGNVFSTDGVDDYMTVAPKPQFYLGENNADYTVAFWFLDRTGSTGTDRPIVHKGKRHWNNTFAVWMGKNDETVGYRASTTGSVYDGGKSNSQIPTNTWTHITYVKEGNKAYLYLNGEFEALTTLGGETLPNNDTLYVGAHRLYGDYTNGAFDDLVIYDRALSATEAGLLAKETEEKYLLAHWPMNKDGKEVINSVDALALNAPSFEDDATRGQVVSLDGTNDFLMARHQSILELGRANKPFSVSLWIKLNQGFNGARRTILRKASSNIDNNFSIQLNQTDNRLIYQMTTTSGLENTISVNALSLNTWHHIAYSYDGINKIKFYIDGTLDSDMTLSGNPEPNTGPLYIGDDPWNDPIGASIDDVKILNKAYDALGLGKQMIDTKPFVMGNHPYTGGTLDIGKANLLVNQTDIFTNNLNVPVEVQLEGFWFYAQRLGNPLTPFVAKNSVANFEVLAIGTTRSSADYEVGENRVDFFDGDPKTVVLQPGESLYPGFIDANPDGSGDGINSVIPYETIGATDNFWYTGANAGSGSASISEGNDITEGTTTSAPSRNYKFEIEATVLGAQSMVNQTIDVEKVGVVRVTDGSVSLQTSSTFGMPLEYELKSGPATLEGPEVILSGTSGQVVVEVSQPGNSHLNPATMQKISFFVAPAGSGTGGGTGLTATYYNDTAMTSQAMTRIDTAINFTWGAKSPGPLVNPSTFAVVWEGEIEAPFTETITFKSTTDDGVRLWVDGQLIIDNWNDQMVNSNYGSISMGAWTRVPIRMEYYQNKVYAEAQLEWSSPSMEEEIVPTSFLYPQNTSLPIELSDFDVKLIGQQSLLSWASANENGASHYTVERSIDAQLFEPLTQVKVQGGGNSPAYYEWIDQRPDYGVNYYRLKMVDLDGSFSYSKIRSVNLTGDQLWVYPNPGKIGQQMNAMISFKNSNVARVAIMDLSGRKVRQKDYTLENGKADINIATGDLTPGSYLVIATAGDGTQLVKKILISK